MQMSAVSTGMTAVIVLVMLYLFFRAFSRHRVALKAKATFPS